LDKYLSDKQRYLPKKLKNVKSTTAKSSLELFFKQVTSDNSSGAFKLLSYFKDKEFSNQAYIYFFSSFIVVDNKMYFYVMPTKIENRGGQVVLNSASLRSSFLNSANLDTNFTPTNDLLALSLVVDVDTIVISADTPHKLINYLVLAQKTYAYALYRAWSTLFPTMHKGIDVDKFIDFLDNLNPNPHDKAFLQTFFKEWTFNDENKWLGQTKFLSTNGSLNIRQFFSNDDNVKIKDELSKVEINTLTLMQLAMQEMKSCANIDFNIDEEYKDMRNGVTEILNTNKPVLTVINSEQTPELHLLIQFVATMDYYTTSKAVGWTILSLVNKLKPEATNSLLDLGDEMPINALPLNVKYFFPKEIWENDTHYQFFKDNVKTNIDWFFLMVAYYKNYDLVSLAWFIIENNTQELIKTKPYTIDSFKLAIREWYDEHKDEIIPELLIALNKKDIKGKSNLKELLTTKANLKRINKRVKLFFNGIPNCPSEISSRKIHSWIEIHEDGIKLNRINIENDSSWTKKQIDTYLKDHNWSTVKQQLHLEFGQPKQEDTKLLETFMARLTIILFS
jgi:hypothetical protein